MCENNINPLQAELAACEHRIDSLRNALEQVKSEKQRALDLASELITQFNIDVKAPAVLDLVRLGMEPFVYTVEGVTEVTIKFMWRVEDVPLGTGSDLLAVAVEDFIVDSFDTADGGVLGDVNVNSDWLTIYASSYLSDTTTSHEAI